MTRSKASSRNINYSNIPGGEGFWGGVGNIDIEPRFVDADGPDDIVGTEDDNLRLLPDSPLIDAGDPSATVTLRDADDDIDLYDMRAFQLLCLDP